MKVDIFEKATNIKKLINKNYEVKIEKVIEIDVDWFHKFENDLLNDYDFIKDNVDFMYIDNHNVWHCILITYSGSDYGILVESEGYHYARYSAYLELNNDIDELKWEKYSQFKTSNGNNTPF